MVARDDTSHVNTPGSCLHEPAAKTSSHKIRFFKHYFTDNAKAVFAIPAKEGSRISKGTVSGDIPPPETVNPHSPRILPARLQTPARWQPKR